MIRWFRSLLFLAFGFALGPLIGGVLTDVFGWRSIFVLDLKLGDESGLQLLPEIKRLAPDAEVVLLTGYSSIDISLSIN